MACRPDEAQPQDHVARRRPRAVDDPRALDDADAAAGQVELVGLEQARVLRRLAADQGRPGHAAAGGHAADELGDADRVEPADRDVVEEGERLGAAAHDVVRAHRDEVDADRVEPADRRRRCAVLVPTPSVEAMSSGSR